MLDFESIFKNYDVPTKIRKASEELCTKYTIRGVCDPVYICNVIAFESGSGDGESHFSSDSIKNIDTIASRLVYAYGCNIKQTELEDVKAILNKFA